MLSNYVSLKMNFNKCFRRKFTCCKNLPIKAFIWFFGFFQSDILDVNEIFKDLATLVNEQGETIGKKR